MNIKNSLGHENIQGGKTMNDVIQQQLNHKTIRSFKAESLTKDEISTLIDVARQAPTSNFMQAYSIISITNQALKEELTKIGQQPYIAENGHLFVFVADQRRNFLIAQEQGIDATLQGSTERFLAAFADAMIAAQNVLVAAESMGMGAVFLGSLWNDEEKVIDLLQLPKYTFPAVGLVVGWPNQEPQVKPRLPQEIIHMENGYQDLKEPAQQLSQYDKDIQTYYDLRDTRKHVDAFTKQIAGRMSNQHPGRLKILKALHQQGFLDQ